MIYTVYLMFVAIFAVLISQVTDTMSEESEKIVYFEKEQTKEPAKTPEEPKAENAIAANVANDTADDTSDVIMSTSASSDDDDEMNDFADEFMMDIQRGV